MIGAIVSSGDRDLLTVETTRGSEQTISTTKYEVTGRGGKGKELMQRGGFTRVVPSEVAGAGDRGRIVVHANDRLAIQELPSARVIPMAENKTKPTTASVSDYIASRADEQQHKDCRALMALFKKITKQSPKMWGPSMVGYGSFRYVYESGRSGESPLAAFAIRGRELVVYVRPEETLSEHHCCPN